MKSDRYLKTVLTVIAVSLIVLVFQNSKMEILPTANAQSGMNHGVIDVNIVSVNGNRLSGAIPVSGEVVVKNTPSVKVDQGFGNTLNVNIKNTPTVKVETSYSGLDVNVKNVRDFK